MRTLCMCELCTHRSAKTPSPLPKLFLTSTSLFSWSSFAPFSCHIASVALARSAVTVACPKGSRINAATLEHGTWGGHLVQVIT